MIFKDIPLYEGFITDEKGGIVAISLVNNPAVQSFFQRYSKETLAFSLDTENRQVIAPLMRCEYPIYRNDINVGEYYIKYNKEQVAKMAKKLLTDGAFNNISLEHTSDYQDGVQLSQIFIKNTSKGINPMGFEDIEDGSLFGVYSIDNDEIWNGILDGNFRGFSIEGFFTLEKVNDVSENEEEILNDILEMIKDAIK